MAVGGGREARRGRGAARRRSPGSPSSGRVCVRRARFCRPSFWICRAGRRRPVGSCPGWSVVRRLVGRGVRSCGRVGAGGSSVPLHRRHGVGGLPATRTPPRLHLERKQPSQESQQYATEHHHHHRDIHGRSPSIEAESRDRIRDGSEPFGAGGRARGDQERHIRCARCARGNRRHAGSTPCRGEYRAFSDPFGVLASPHIGASWSDDRCEGFSMLCSLAGAASSAHPFCARRFTVSTTWRHVAPARMVDARRTGRWRMRAWRAQPSFGSNSARSSSERARKLA